MTVTRNADGQWQVVFRGAVLAGPFSTDADAWRWIDRHEGQPVSASEKRGEWSWNEFVDRSFGG